MGFIKITMQGSFGVIREEFSSIDNGHADAVAQAIAFLSRKLLPEATALDHRLHNDGDEPKLGWVRQRT